MNALPSSENLFHQTNSTWVVNHTVTIIIDIHCCTPVERDGVSNDLSIHIRTRAVPVDSHIAVGSKDRTFIRVDRVPVNTAVWRSAREIRVNNE